MKIDFPPLSRVLMAPRLIEDIEKFLGRMIDELMATTCNVVCVNALCRFHFFCIGAHVNSDANTSCDIMSESETPPN